MPIGMMEQKSDPVEMLDKALDQAWCVVCSSCDVTAGLPDMVTLFDQVDLSIPRQAANKVVANMLLDVMENVSRFSPWYKMPARAFGLVSIRDRQTNELYWNLAPEIEQKWCSFLEELAIAIRKSNAVIQASVIVDGYLAETEDCFVSVRCGCIPARKLNVSRIELENADIICDACRHPFV